MLILEDDVGFKDNFDNLLTIVLNELPDNWDALWMGGTVNKWEDCGSNLIKRLISSTGGYCILMRETMYAAAINILSLEQFQADVSYGKIQKDFQCFRTIQNLILHKAGVSTIQKIFIHHKDLSQ